MAAGRPCMKILPCLKTRRRQSFCEEEWAHYLATLACDGAVKTQAARFFGARNTLRYWPAISSSRKSVVPCPTSTPRAAQGSRTTSDAHLGSDPGQPHTIPEHTRPCWLARAPVCRDHTRCPLPPMCCNLVCSRVVSQTGRQLQ